jgi:acetyl-CoA acyltransferase
MMAGGVESMSRIPMGGNLISPDYDLVQKQPEAYMSMGLTAERVAEKYNITREEQDSFAVESHQKAAAAIKAGKFEAEIVPIKYKKSHLDSKRKLITEEFEFKVDEGVRADTTLEGLAKLKAVFKVNGTVTAGNCSQTSDGAAMTILTSESYAQENNITPIARLIKYAVIGVPPEIMGIGPAFAIPKVLEKAGMKLEDIDLFEINEAFASQAVATVKELGIPLNKVNVNGGAIALGHPLGCTGAKLTVQLLHEMKRRGNKFGIVSMCIGGGMGAAGIFEML